MFKSVFSHETYLDVRNVRKIRSALARLRTLSHDLEKERGRFNTDNREDRVCKLCGNGMENEVYFLVICTSLQHLRNTYIPRKYNISALTVFGYTYEQQK